MEHAKPLLRRCAIYTRKSSEEGLEQNFNSLHAQREACEAFIKSQASEGWRLVKTHYDDGGISGASIERPALQHLLGDIRQGLVEVVVVYKVDRLTRSLADFAKWSSCSTRITSPLSPSPSSSTPRPRWTAHAQCAALVRAVRARGDRGTDPRQDRRLQAQGHVDGWGGTAGLRLAGAAPGH